MIRFAVTITIVELVLTIGAVLLIEVTELPDPFLSETDLTDLGLKHDSYEAWRSSRFRTLVRYNTAVSLRQPKRELYTSFRVNDSKLDFELRRDRERNRLGEGPQGKDVLIEEELPGQPGYAVRDFREEGIRIELVCGRGNEMLIVRIVQGSIGGVSLHSVMANAERNARKVQMKLFDKMRWR